MPVALLAYPVFDCRLKTDNQRHLNFYAATRLGHFLRLSLAIVAIYSVAFGYRKLGIYKKLLLIDRYSNSPISSCLILRR